MRGSAGAAVEPAESRKRSREEEGDESDEDAPVLVQCDLCSKWRSLPETTKVSLKQPCDHIHTSMENRSARMGCCLISDL